MREQRSSSQILFGFLPDQTVDLRGRTWLVKKWRHPVRKDVHLLTLRRELCRAAGPWEAAGKDGRFVERVRSGAEVKVYSVDTQNGVSVELFPQVWMCRACKRVAKSSNYNCKCGQRWWGQLPFVGYHDACGTLQSPYIPRCPEHNDVRAELPGTASAAEIKFVCPECNKVLRQGFGFPKCDCGQGRLTFNVHRAASVYTPRTIVLVNPPTTAKMKQLVEAGGAQRALAWALTGFEAENIEELGTTPAAMRAQLLAGGIDAVIVDQMIEMARKAGQFESGQAEIDLPESKLEGAEDGALNIALATFEARLTIAQLTDTAPAESVRRRIYTDFYPPAMKRARVEAVELIDKFPVLTGNYGYTRGSSKPGESRLVPFRARNGDYVVYAALAETEALFVRLEPITVAAWLERRGHELPEWGDTRSARLAILTTTEIPPAGSEVTTPTPGSDLLTLIHGFSHRLIRRVAALAGIDRNALSELLVPLHLGFFVYAAARGDFVLGGLQAVFENDLHVLLDDFVGGDHRCALDPGCRSGGGACMACLHLGEPSCRYYNRFLDRSHLFGSDGYLRFERD